MLHLPSKQPTLAHDTQTTIVEHGFSNHSTWTVQKDTIAKMTFHHVRGGRCAGRGRGRRGREVADLHGPSFGPRWVHHDEGRVGARQG